tara:strand:- start:367 stop:627 length:261 start_codon:yes stop_codon:yes gene_type:complete
VLVSLFLLCQKIHTASVIIKYRVVQTGAKIQSGGLKFDFSSWEYHGSLELKVVNLPIIDAEKVIVRKRVNDRNLFLSIKVLYITIL